MVRWKEQDPSLLPFLKLVAVTFPLSMTTVTMNNLANEKGSGSIYESNGISVEHHLGSGTNGGSGLSTSTVYGRNPLPKPACPASVNPL